MDLTIPKWAIAILYEFYFMRSEIISKLFGVMTLIAYCCAASWPDKAQQWGCLSLWQPDWWYAYFTVWLRRKSLCSEIHRNAFPTTPHTFYLPTLFSRSVAEFLLWLCYVLHSMPSGFPSSIMIHLSIWVASPQQGVQSWKKGLTVRAMSGHIVSTLQLGHIIKRNQAIVQHTPYRLAGIKPGMVLFPPWV